MAHSVIVSPTLVRDAEARNYARFVISPLARGYGVTLGNSMRRVFLSSLEGAALNKKLHQYGLC